ILLMGVVAEVSKREHDDRQPRCRACLVGPQRAQMPSREPGGDEEQSADDAGDHAAPRSPPRCLGGWPIGARGNARTTLKLLVRGSELIHPIARWQRSYRRGW